MVFVYIALAIIIFIAGAYFGWTFLPNGAPMLWSSAMDVGKQYRIWVKMPEHSACFEAIIQEKTGSGSRILVVLPCDQFAELAQYDIIEKKIEKGDLFLYHIKGDALGKHTDVQA